MTTYTATAPAEISYRVDCERRYPGRGSTWVTFRAADGTRVTLGASALKMALHLSGVDLHRQMTLAEIAWACVAGVRLGGGPAQVENLDARARQIALNNVANGTDYTKDPEYRRLLPTGKRYDLLFNLVHHRLLWQIPDGRDIVVGAGPDALAGAEVA
ncbi:hypothetical protein LWC34_21995 [Kibdelosporangium philippinense]|uniref:Uncharacterized protein n=1 Tax=Kibdelosporangium philippinense TaxID=211113 RepID=A0ABS8ZC95_9PSEU|nr:hypothetical protein [Kibdelosporangium philippinense]MCE7005474.1 hypothetical protein [Kibdelosporangium philippinense]